MIGGGSAIPLPPATRPAPAPRIIVSIASKGEIFVGGELVTEAALPAKLRAFAARNKGAELVISADKRAPNARGTFVLDHAKQSGLTRVSLAIEGGAGPTK